jgi:D-glycero-D-manno-heptose 1,7-bisphosphate phosphatase
MSPPDKPVVLVDRDGVLNVDLPHGVRAIAELAVERGAVEGVAALTRAGYTVLVITNQGAVGRGHLSPRDLAAINAELAARIADGGGAIAGFYVCPHSEADACACRKPKPGLLLQAAREWGFDPAATWFVGDAGRDVEAARAAGVRPALVYTGKGMREAPRHPEVPAFADLAAFAAHVVEQGA